MNCWKAYGLESTTYPPSSGSGSTRTVFISPLSLSSIVLCRMRVKPPRSLSGCRRFCFMYQ